MSLVLITGINGLIGSHVAKILLSEGVAIRGLKRTGSDMALLKSIENQIDWIEGDILDVTLLTDAMKGVSHIVHAAALVSFAPRDKQQMFKVNIEGTANMVNIALEAGIKRFLYVSSIAALGRPANQKSIMTTITENQKWEESEVNSNYAKSKYLGELEMWRGIAEGLDAVAVCPSMVLGSGDWDRSSTKLFKYVFDENTYYSEGLVNYVDVNDVASIIVKLLFSEITNERFILNAGYTTYKDLFEKMAIAFGKKAPSKLISPIIAETIWRIEAIRSWLTGKQPLITKETARTAQNKFIYDNTTIKKALDIEFTPLEQTIKRVTGELIRQKAS